MEYREFLRSTLPLLGLRWRRFRTKTMRRRIVARLQDLGLSSLSEYGAYVLGHAEEQRLLADRLAVTISRFWRNRFVFEALKGTWLPTLIGSVRPGEPFRVWSAGCASGEEPYSFLILWEEGFGSSGHKLLLVASDADSRCLHRGRRGRYPPSSLRELPLELRRRYFVNDGGDFLICPPFPEQVLWMEHNLLWDPPVPANHLILCRNLAYTYFTEPVQQEITRRFHRALLPGGLLVIGRKDQLPAGAERLFRQAEPAVYQRLGVKGDE
jgi:chemotaxis protein methyltransferase CheR